MKYFYIAVVLSMLALGIYLGTVKRQKEAVPDFHTQPEEQTHEERQEELRKELLDPTNRGK